MKNTNWRLPIYLLFSLVTIANAKTTLNTNSLSKAEKIDQLVSTYNEYGKFNGTILVSEKSEILYKRGFGWANMEWDIPNQTTTKFKLASVTKQFTAMLIMQLVAEGKLALDVPITTYLPDYPKESGNKITAHHLLTHTSGIPNYTAFDNYRELMSKPIEPTELVALFADSTLQFTPGERFQYSNSAYVLLGVLIEKITGKPYGAVLEEKICNPLNMKDTGFHNGQSILKNRARGYYNNIGSFTNSSYIDLSVAFSAGGIYSTVEDLYRWDQALYTEKLLPKKYMDLIFGKHIPAWGKHYGYGWMIGEKRVGNSEDRVNVIEHDGVINGFNTLILRIPSDHSSITILNNTGDAPIHQMAEAILGILYDKTYDFPKQSIARSLHSIIDREGIIAGLSFYEKVKDSSSYLLDEREMNLAAYHFLEADQNEKAIAILKLNIEAFPNAFNVYDSYAEALMKMGNHEEAIKNYKKSLRLNPRNENGIQMLKKLGVEVNRANLYFLKTDDSWGKEIFTFPLRFAKEIDYEGVEEAHFPKGWRNEESIEFWSYTYVWNIKATDELNKSSLENNLQLYFDGLMKAVNREKDRVLPKTIAKLDKRNGNAEHFTGTIEIFDAFVTQKMMTLTTSIEMEFCEIRREYILVFKFSPKDFGHEIWRTLEAIKLRENACENVL